MPLLAPETVKVETLPALPFAERLRLPDVAAIYFVLDALGGVQYIGRANRLKKRWIGHHRLDEFSHISNAHIAYLIITDVSLLPDIERALIARFEPPCNQHGQGMATIHVKVNQSERERLLWLLRAQGTTMQAFFADIVEMVVADEDFFDMLTMRRFKLGSARCRALGLTCPPAPVAAAVGA